MAILSFLPETSFCFLRGNCRNRALNIGPGRGRFYDTYRKHWRQQQNHHRRTSEDYYDDYYYDMEEPDILKKKGMEAKTRSKRDANYAYEDYEEIDASILPAEHRQLTPAKDKQSRNPM